MRVKGRLLRGCFQFNDKCQTEGGYLWDTTERVELCNVITTETLFPLPKATHKQTHTRKSNLSEHFSDILDLDGKLYLYDDR